MSGSACNIEMHVYLLLYLVKTAIHINGLEILITCRTHSGCDRCCLVGVVGWDCSVDAHLIGTVWDTWHSCP